MEGFSGMSGLPVGRTQQMPQGPGMYGSSPMSPTRAEAGCAGVPVPPSTPSTVSRQVPNAGDVSFSVGPTGGCAQQNNVDNTGSFSHPALRRDFLALGPMCMATSYWDAHSGVTNPLFWLQW